MAKQKLRKDQMHLDFSVSFSLTWTRELCLDCEIQRGEKQMWWSFNIQDMNYEIKWRNLLPKYRTSSAFTCGILFSVNQILQEFHIGFGIGTIKLVCYTEIGERDSAKLDAILMQSKHARCSTYGSEVDPRLELYGLGLRIIPHPISFTGSKPIICTYYRV